MMVWKKDYVFNWNNIEKKYLFTWDENPEKDYERIREILNKYYSIDWVKTAKFEKSDDNKTISASVERNYLSLSLNDEKNKVNLIIDDDRTDEFIVKIENGKRNIYEKNNDDKKNLKEFLKENFKADWAENADVTKTCDRIRIFKDDKSAEITLGKRAILKFSDGRTHILEAKDENGNINIYKETNGIGNSSMGFAGIVLIALYNISLTLILLTGIVIILPTVALGTDLKNIIILGFDLSVESRLVLVVALSGALGGLVHSLRSFYWYLGNRELVWSWVGMYLLMPFVGIALGVVFYLIIRGGFFSPQATVQQTSPFGFAALSALVGLFSEQATLKLKKVAETVLTEAEVGKNSKLQGAKIK